MFGKRSRIDVRYWTSSLLFQNLKLHTSFLEKYSQDLTFVIFCFPRRNDQYVHPTSSAVRDFGFFSDCFQQRDKVPSISVLLLL